METIITLSVMVVEDQSMSMPFTAALRAPERMEFYCRDLKKVIDADLR